MQLSDALLGMPPLPSPSSASSSNLELLELRQSSAASTSAVRDLDFVLYNKTGSAIFWDGRIYRTVVNNYTVQQSQFFDLTAPGNPLLPHFPRDVDPLDAGAPDDASVSSAATTAVVVPVSAAQRPMIPVPNASVDDGAAAAPILVPQNDQGPSNEHERP
jgi:hypothetical protein